VKHYTCVLSFLLCTAALGDTPPPLKPGEPMDQVVVTASQKKLSQLEAQLREAEDQFYARYNELQSDRRFKVTCTMEAPMGSLIKGHVCRPQFVSDANERRAEELFGVGKSPPASMAIIAHDPEFESSMLSVINHDPQLKQWLQDHDSLQRRYDRMRVKMFGKAAGHPPSLSAPEGTAAHPSR
jgi:hypothetical protein